MGIEDKLFTWENWDLLDTAAFVFYDAELTEPVGKFKVGTKFSSIVIDYENSYIELWSMKEDKRPVGKYSIELVIAAELPINEYLSEEQLIEEQ